MRTIKISSSKYNELKGEDWPEYKDYLNGFYPASVKQEIQQFERGTFKADINNIEQLYDFDAITTSQANQDLFVIAVMQGNPGTYLEIGAGYPIVANNTYLLEKKYGFTGLSIEKNNDHVYEWNKEKRNLLIADALNLSFCGYYDYLQVDIFPTIAHIDIIKNIIPQCEFGIITFEHDLWRNTDEVRYVAEESRRILDKHGYVMAAKNIRCEEGQFEDWYLNPKYIDQHIIDTYTNLDTENSYEVIFDLNFSVHPSFKRHAVY